MRTLIGIMVGLLFTGDALANLQTVDFSGSCNNRMQTFPPVNAQYLPGTAERKVL